MGLFCDYDDGGLRESVVKIYSLRADSWKRIGDFNFGVPYDDTRKFAGGKLHFAASKGMDFGSSWNIVSLDLESETYGIVEQPSYGEKVSLSRVACCLSILYVYDTKRMDLCVLKEERESWTRVASPVAPRRSLDGRRSSLAGRRRRRSERGRDFLFIFSLKSLIFYFK